MPVPRRQAVYSAMCWKMATVNMPSILMTVGNKRRHGLQTQISGNDTGLLQLWVLMWYKALAFNCTLAMCGLCAWRILQWSVYQTCFNQIFISHMTNADDTRTQPQFCRFAHTRMWRLWRRKQVRAHTDTPLKEVLICPNDTVRVICEF